jgi:hypothetical protein
VLRSLKLTLKSNLKSTRAEHECCINYIYVSYLLGSSRLMDSYYLIDIISFTNICGGVHLLADRLMHSEILVKHRGSMFLGKIIRVLHKLRKQELNVVLSGLVNYEV